MHIIHFGANGWRARFDDGFDDDGIARAADAIGLIWADRHPGATVYVGYDCRRDAGHHAWLLGSVMATFGLDVRLSDRPVPTPVVTKAAAEDDGAVGAIVVTASESPPDWGGLLVRGADGGPLGSARLAEIERCISGDPPTGRGQVRTEDLASPYLDALLGQVDVGVISGTPPLVVCDALFGAARTLAPYALSRAGCEVLAIHAESDPDFGGLVPVPREPWTRDCSRAVVDHGAACGIVFDGDGGRVSLVDEHGELLAPHDMVTLVADHLIRVRGLAGSVVVTSASSARIRRRAERLGRGVSVVPVGFERIYGELLDGEVALASEEQGGLCVPAWLPERDGLLAAVLAVERIAQSGKNLSELVADLRHSDGPMEYGQRDIRLDPAQIQALRNVLPGLNPSSVAGRVPVAVSHADGLRLEFSDDSWMMLRPARTQPVVRAYAEAQDADTCATLLDAAQAIARIEE